MRGIHIEECANGWIVKVGCQTFVYDDLEFLLVDMECYLRDPENYEKEVLENAQNYQRQQKNSLKCSLGAFDRSMRDAYNECSQGVGGATASSYPTPITCR